MALKVVAFQSTFWNYVQISSGTCSYSTRIQKGFNREFHTTPPQQKQKNTSGNCGGREGGMTRQKCARNGAQFIGSQDRRIWSRKIAKSLICMIFDIRRNSLHHQIPSNRFLRPANWSSSFLKRWGVISGASK